MKGIQLIDYDLQVKVEKDKFGKIMSGLVVGDILHQNQGLLLSIMKGELKENPSIGVGMREMLLEHNLMDIRNEIRQQLEMDGQKVKTIKISTDSVLIDANY